MSIWTWAYKGMYFSAQQIPHHRIRRAAHWIEMMPTVSPQQAEMSGHVSAYLQTAGVDGRTADLQTAARNTCMACFTTRSLHLRMPLNSYMSGLIGQ